MIKIKADQYKQYSYSKELNTELVLPGMKKANQIKIYNQIDGCGRIVFAIECDNCNTDHFAGFMSCRSRWCISCQHKKTLCWLAKLMPIVNDWNGNSTMLNLTIKDTDKLIDGLNLLNDSWRSFYNDDRKYREKFKRRFPGGVRSLEVKVGKNSEQWHPHYHMYCLQPLDYEKDYDWVKERWKSISGGSVYIRQIKGNKLKGLIEVIKYILKPEESIYKNDKRLNEAIKALTGKRQINSWGIFRGIEKEVEEMFDTYEEKKLSAFICAKCGCTEGYLKRLLYETLGNTVLYDSIRSN